MLIIYFLVGFSSNEYAFLWRTTYALPLYEVKYQNGMDVRLQKLFYVYMIWECCHTFSFLDTYSFYDDKDFSVVTAQV